MRDVPILSLRIRPLSVAELVILRLLSRLQADADALFRSVLRLRFLRSSIGMTLGVRAARGMTTAEACLLLLLASQPAASADQARRKGLLVRDFLGDEPRGNADAMLTAAIEADFARLGLVATSDADERKALVVH